MPRPPTPIMPSRMGLPDAAEASPRLPLTALIPTAPTAPTFKNSLRSILSLIACSPPLPHFWAVYSPLRQRALSRKGIGRGLFVGRGRVGSEEVGARRRLGPTWSFDVLFRPFLRLAYTPASCYLLCRDLDAGANVGNTSLSRGERVDRDGAFSSRRGPGEGLLPAPSELILPRLIRAATLSPCIF